MIHWCNHSGVDLTDDNLEQLLGFIYRIDLQSGQFYYGRKQFWNKKGRYWYESDWRDYNSSSNNISPEEIAHKSIVAVFSRKSYLRYAEALAIICSGSYESVVLGLNYSFQGARGRLGESRFDREQLNRLRLAWAK